MALYVQDDFKLTPTLTVNLGLRWAYTQPLVEKDNRQGNFDLTTGAEILAADGSRESRALYKSYKKGFEPRLGFAWRPSERWVYRGAYGISQYMEGTGANLRLPLNPPFFFESAAQYDSTTGPGSLATGFAELVPLDKPSGQVRAWRPNLRPQFTQQWNVFAEYLLTPSTSANIGYVGNHATHLVTPVEGNQPLPGVGDVSTWAPLQTRRPLYDTAPLITNISTTASEGHSDYQALQASVRQRNIHGFEYLASYTLSRVRSNNLGYYGSGGVAAEGAYWMNAYNPEANYGPAFFDARHNFVFSANYEIPYGRGRTHGSDISPLLDGVLGGWRLSGIYQARSGFPITVIDGTGAVAAGHARQRAAQLRRRSGSGGSEHQPLAGHLGLLPRRQGHVRQLRRRRRPRARLPEHRRRAREAVQRRRPSLLRVPRRGLQPAQPSELQSARARHQLAEHVRPDHDHGKHGANDRAGVQVLLLESEGLCPSDSPTRALAGTPAIPAPRAWLTRFARSRAER